MLIFMFIQEIKEGMVFPLYIKNSHIYLKLLTCKSLANTVIKTVKMYKAKHNFLTFVCVYMLLSIIHHTCYKTAGI